MTIVIDFILAATFCYIVWKGAKDDFEVNPKENE